MLFGCFLGPLFFGARATATVERSFFFNFRADQEPRANGADGWQKKAPKENMRHGGKTKTSVLGSLFWYGFWHSRHQKLPILSIFGNINKNSKKMK